MLNLEQIIEISMKNGVEVNYGTDGKHYIKNEHGEKVELDSATAINKALNTYRSESQTKVIKERYEYHLNSPKGTNYNIGTPSSNPKSIGLNAIAA